jgi:hypothetical protein
MEQSISFGEVLEAVDKLSTDEQQVLLDIVSHRLADSSRKKIASEIQESRKEFSEGQCKPASPQQIMDDILS